MRILLIWIFWNRIPVIVVINGELHFLTQLVFRNPIISKVFYFKKSSLSVYRKYGTPCIFTNGCHWFYSKHLSCLRFFEIHDSLIMKSWTQRVLLSSPSINNLLVIDKCIPFLFRIQEKYEIPINDCMPKKTIFLKQR